MHGTNDSVARLDVEWVAMKAGLKPANRVTIAPERVAELEARVQREGLAAVRAPHVITFPGRPPAVILYLSPDAARARALATAEAPLLAPDSPKLRVDEVVPLHLQLGHLLGFPECCVEEFVARLRRSVTRRRDGREAHEDFVAAEHAVHASTRFLGRLNDLAADRHVRIVTFYPCRYDCTAAALYAGQVFAAIESSSAAAAAALRAALLGTFSIAVDGRRGAVESSRTETLTVSFPDL